MSSGCKCGSDCKCGDNCGCEMCPDLSYAEKATYETLIIGVAPEKALILEGSEMGVGAENDGCKCGSSCKCDPCTCK